MPNYEYKCKECDIKFELWQEVGAAAPPCQQCGGTVRKVLHAPKLHFKGSGFYVTDLASEKKAKTTPAKTETATETKPAATETVTPTPAAPASVAPAAAA